MPTRDDVLATVPPARSDEGEVLVFMSVCSDVVWVLASERDDIVGVFKSARGGEEGIRDSWTRESGEVCGVSGGESGRLGI